MRRIFTRVFSCVMLAVVCMTAASCGRKNAAPGIFYPVGSVVKSVDPQIASSRTERLLVLNCFEGLVRIGTDGGIIPGAAESWTVSPDGLKYTFNLRENTYWHITAAAASALKDKLPEDFRPLVTANDFVFGLRRALLPGTGARDAYLLRSVTNAVKVNTGEADVTALGVKAMSDYVLEITLDMPDESFLSTLAEAVAMPCNETFFNATGGRYGLLIKYLMFNGPLYLAVLYDESWRMDPNTDYTGENKTALPYVWLYYNSDRAKVISYISDASYTTAVLNELERKQLDEKSKASLIQNDNVTMAFVFNHSSAVFKNKNMRRAFCLATDTSQIAGLFSQEKAYSLLPRSYSAVESSALPVFNKNTALASLREGLEQLQMSSAQVNIYVGNGYHQALSTYLQTWQSILGVNFAITLTPVSDAELENAVLSGKCDAAFYPLVGDLSGETGFLMNLMPDSEASPLNMKAGAFELTMLRSQLLSAQDKDMLEKEAADILTGDCSVLPVMYQSTYTAVNSGLTGIYSPYGNEVMFFAGASFDAKKG